MDLNDLLAFGSLRVCRWIAATNTTELMGSCDNSVDYLRGIAFWALALADAVALCVALSLLGPRRVKRHTAG